MKKYIFFIILFYSFNIFSQNYSKKEIKKWEKMAQNITIIRDNWGIPHIYGKTDADAVFGLLYAQCEDDFKRVEMNYIEKLGRMAEVKGEGELYEDLLIRMIIDSTEAIADYKKAPDYLKRILNAQADAINYFLYKNPTVKPALLTRFQPWYNLLWTDGSIGAISTDDLTATDLKNLYGNGDAMGHINHQKNAISTPFEPSTRYKETYEGDEILTGSNGFAFSPKITEGGKAILYINPHVTFYFRPEVHVVSEEGLNTYGAVTWGQFFVYQGFNEKCGWMHTSNYTDITDTYIEKVSNKSGKWFYEYEGKQLPIKQKYMTFRYKKGDKIVEKNITALYTHHGPIMAKRNGQWLSMKSNNRSMLSLIQSWQRTKAKSFADYQKTMDLRQNTSNNTVYADAEGNIAYWHGNFMPRRDTSINWTKPVDGSLKKTEWQGLHPVSETYHVYNPLNGWLQNCNSTPLTCAGENSPKKRDYPKYMTPDGENFRGINAVKVLANEQKYTIDKVIKAGYDTKLAAFEVLIPALIKAFEANELEYVKFKQPMMLLKEWDFRSSETSIPTTLAIEWGTRLLPKIQTVKGILLEEEADQVTKTKHYVATAPANELLAPFGETLEDLKKKFGTWQVAWGEINRYQRASSDIVQQYDDNKPSVPVGFASSAWGMLPSYTARYYKDSKKRYGVNGNSFICAVEFGDKIKAKSLLAGGQSGNPNSKHFADQLERYTKGEFKDVLFYKEDILKNAERTYHPGE